MEIDWEELSQKDLVRILAGANAEKQRRIAEMHEASGLQEAPAAPKGPGRPRTNGVSAQD